MDYAEAVRALESLSREGIKPGLERINCLLDRLGRPDAKFNAILVGGTNGKGSTCAYLASLLRAAGFKVGLYTSPHLLDWRERIEVNGRRVSPAEFACAVERALEASKGLDDAPTTFEVLTAAAMWHFARKRVDYAVLEVGLGGRLDATNAASRVVASIVTNVGLDHREWLGNSRRQIAREKAGIARPGKPFVTATEKGKGRATLVREAKRRGALPIVVGEDAPLTIHPDGSFDLRWEGREVRGLVPGIEGIVQPLNAACALACFWALGLDLRPSQIARALARTRLAGRFQVVNRKPCVILDVAHNAEAAKCLRETFRKKFPNRRALLVCAMLSDKPHKEFARALRPVISRAFLAPTFGERGFSGRALSRKFAEAGVSPRRVFPNIARALKIAFKDARPEEVILVCGSFLTVGEAVKSLCSSSWRGGGDKS